MTASRNLELQDLLSSLRGDGEMVSQESDFTLNFEQAKEKLKEFQLSNPFFYILKLVQSAVLAGATKIEIKCQAQQVGLEHDGLPPAPEQLHGLLNYLFLTKEQETTLELSSLNRLASGVNTAVAAHARELVITCCRHGESYRQRWTSDGAEYTSLETDETKNSTRFLLQRKSEDVASSLRHVGTTRILDLVRAHRNSIQKEEAALWDRCTFSPIPIWVNGERVDRTEFGVPRYPSYQGRLKGRVPLGHWFRNRKHYIGRYCHRRFHLIQAFHSTDSSLTSLRAPETTHSFLVSREHPHVAGKPCSLCLGLESNRELPNRINYVREGVLIQQEILPFSVGGLVALVNANQLDTDLSGFHLIQNLPYSDAQKFLRQSVEGLLSEYQARAKDIPFKFPLKSSPKTQ